MSGFLETLWYWKKDWGEKRWLVNTADGEWLDASRWSVLAQRRFNSGR